jgi:hypothetical protein
MFVDNKENAFIRIIKNIPMDSAEKCVVYSRRPIHRYGQELDTDHQVEICVRFCDKDNIVVVAQFCDYSRRVTDIPELWKMLQSVQSEGNIRYVVVADIGYLAQPLKWSKMAANMVLSDESKDFEVIDVANNSRKLFSKLCEEIRFANGKNVSDAMKGHAKTGKWMGRPSVGYRSVKIVELRKDEKHKDTVDVALTMKLYSTAKDQVILNWCHKNGLMINLVTLRSMFSNPIYCGRMRTAATGGTLVKAEHEGYISFEEYVELQKIIRSEGLDLIG